MQYLQDKIIKLLIIKCRLYKIIILYIFRKRISSKKLFETIFCLSNYLQNIVKYFKAFPNTNSGVHLTNIWRLIESK